VVCGNKVPTLEFQNGGMDRKDLFLALANSLPVDWIIRRLITTSVNFFVLNTLPLPRISLRSDTANKLIGLARSITAAEGEPNLDLRQVAQWRAELDAEVARSWGISCEDMRLVMEDFPLLDRRQPILAGELRSTITRDLVISRLSMLTGEDASVEVDRVEKAQTIGAIAYIPEEYA